jgi:hypothetical protein
MTTQNFGVLCTQRQGQPYGSLAFLVENTGNEPSDTFEAVVATGTGRVDELDGVDRSAALERYLFKNPQLTEFVASPSCALLQLTVEVYQVVRRFQEAVEVQVG